MEYEIIHERGHLRVALTDLHDHIGVYLMMDITPPCLRQIARIPKTSNARADRAEACSLAHAAISGASAIFDWGVTEAKIFKPAA
jgi:hypothetical protein